MIRFAFTPSTIKHSFDLWFRNKARKGQSGKRSFRIFAKIALVVASIFAVILVVVLIDFAVVKHKAATTAVITKPPVPQVITEPPVPRVELNLEDWQNSAERQPGERQTLTIGNAEYGFCWIPAGEFNMGSPESEEGRFDDETLHPVSLTEGFWMLETETTQALYEEVMGENPSHFEGDGLPVEKVSWDDATKFCAKLTERLPEGVKASLPTEAQWEYACRAGTKTAYWYGDSADSGKMNFWKSGSYSGSHKTKSTKSYAANPWGLYGMHGNVWEWCFDRYGEYPTGTAVDPMGPSDSPERVTRGGSWSSENARSCRSANRNRILAVARDDNLGFRFVLSCD